MDEKSMAKKSALSMLKKLAQKKMLEGQGEKKAPASAMQGALEDGAEAGAPDDGDGDEMPVQHGADRLHEAPEDEDADSLAERKKSYFQPKKAAPHPGSVSIIIGAGAGGHPGRSSGGFKPLSTTRKKP